MIRLKEKQGSITNAINCAAEKWDLNVIKRLQEIEL